MCQCQLEIGCMQAHASTELSDLIVLEQVCKGYREGDQWHTVLHKVDATFARGETIALMGKSGSGKSTLLNLVSGIDTPDSGDLLVAGQSLVRMNERDRTLFRRRMVGFVFQFFNLVPTLTVLENVLLPLELNGISGVVARRTANELLAHVELESRAHAYPDRLSGGEQQRIAIARALVHAPPLILADEPTGNLDGDTSDHVLALLDRLVRQTGKTMLMVTHSPDVAAVADRVLHLRDGRLVADAPHASPALPV